MGNLSKWQITVTIEQETIQSGEDHGKLKKPLLSYFALATWLHMAGRFYCPEKEEFGASYEISNCWLTVASSDMFKVKMSVGTALVPGGPEDTWNTYQLGNNSGNLMGSWVTKTLRWGHILVVPRLRQLEGSDDPNG